MTQKGIRGFATGLFVATSIMTFFYFYESNSQAEYEYENEELEITNADIEQYLQQQDLVVLPANEHDELLQAIEEFQQGDHTREDEPDSERIFIYQTYLTIERGMSSSEVANELEKANIINDQHEFQNYLHEHNLTQSINIGEYQLNSEMSFEEIATIIS
ncbi:endolytic transglycosylase MltG [Desertibacillus haloalkaliphilus]|uniref:endolytic transglycosylase MltG n=1 Tax=Desertibacillus haloalkaliphilus TaxID=1328930 RepID=UPI001C25E87D|nr:endolytic transglycosylase MltG [Desertibacillus haloalkaliphilus]MBU8905716.1 endolytic transglycosylase MltG [Desertibacillus haloalkaliphilus]